MQIPIEWYTHILPGVIVVISILLVLRPINSVDQLASNIPQTVSASVLWVLASYIVGMVINSAILVFASSTIEAGDWALLFHLNQADLIKALQESYQGMILRRSLSAAFIITFIIALVGIFRHRNQRTLFGLISILSLIASIAFCFDYYKYKDNHNTFYDASLILLREEQHIGLPADTLK